MQCQTGVLVSLCLRLLPRQSRQRQSHQSLPSRLLNLYQVHGGLRVPAALVARVILRQLPLHLPL